MRIIIGLFAIGGFYLSGCSEKVEIQNLPFGSQPVIYCVIDPNDTVHSIRVERMFSGLQAPAITAAHADSLFFPQAKVMVSLTSGTGVEAGQMEAALVEISDKQSGYFAWNKHYLYQFSKILKSGGRNLYSQISISVEVPGMSLATASCRIISTPVIWSPNSAQQYIYIVPDSPLRIQWSGGFWNELDITFEILEEFPDRIDRKFLIFQKVNDVLLNGKYYEIRIPYELIVQEIDKTLKINRNIVRRYFGPVNFIIHTGQQEYAQYIEFLGGINDFNENPFSNVKNGLGLLTSKSSVKKGPMLLDQASRMEFASDPALEKFKFIEY